MRISSFVDRGRAVHKFLIAFLVYLIGGFPTLIYALPQGGTISSGAGSIDTSGSSLTVTQTTKKIIINWESFSIGNNESVIFLQPDSFSSALNNVLGNSRTVVKGNLAANGQIVLSNPNGIFISPTANINVASLIASTLKISEQDFLDGIYKFSQDPNKPLASILNEGRIRASDFAALIAPSVNNKGVVIANLGTVGLVSGEATTIDFVGNDLIAFTIKKPVEGQVLDKDGNLISDRISNSGSIQADGGQVILSAKNASNIIRDVINVEGLISAKTVTKKNGRIFIGGGDQGNVNVAGNLDASGEKPEDPGGKITVAGASVTVDKGSIKAKGNDAKGGEVSIIGTDLVSAGATMDVSGKTGGNINITTGGLSISAPVLAKGTTGQGGNININTLFKSWEMVDALLDVSGASGGSIKHFADQQITTSGNYIAIGTDGKGGSIDVTANTLKFLSNTIDASGSMGGGSIRLGGEFQGGKNLSIDEIPNAQTLIINDSSKITAKAMGSNGAGGRIIAWADQQSAVYGQFDVTPGTYSGVGGFVEVSSGNTLTFNGNVKAGVDNRTGTLFLDPKNITIGSGTSDSISSAVFATNSSDNSTITPATINSALSAGTDVVLQANNDITVSSAITASNSGSGGDLTLQAGRSVLVDANITTDNGDLTLTANDTTSNGVVDGQRDSGAAVITLKSGTTMNTGSGVFTSTIRDGAGKTNFASGDITLSTVTAGSLVATNSGPTSGSDILDNGVLTISGVTTLAAGSGNDITLDTSTNNFATVVITSGRNVSLRDAGAIILGASTVSGTYGITAGGAITDSGTQEITGVTTLAAGSGNDITLDTSTNNFAAAVVITSGNNVAITDEDAIDLGAATVSGTYGITAGGAVTDSGTQEIAGATTISASGQDVTLDISTNNFAAAVGITGAAVTVVDENTIDLGASTVSGTYTITATEGDITDSGNLAITNAATFTTTEASSNIILDQSGNAFSKKVTMKSGNGTAAFGNLTFVNSGPVRLHTSADADDDLYINAATDGTVGGTLSVTASGDITQTVPLVVADTTTLAAGSSNDITLSNASNNFATVVITSGGDVNLRDEDAIDLGAATVSGTYGITAGGAVTDSGTQEITGVTTISAS
ncbi:MAG: filamentous hemagglutinin N-terminal domain-containing protein, partial [Nitrospina sp.]|nr:filamentous hemagglutinin N-terminal domain-containing protein [Nitrospina sp.]